jgi:hypothetical protein
MRKIYLLAMVVLVGIALTGCNAFKKQPVFQLSDLQGLWLQDNDASEHYVRFTTEKSDEAGYLYGREWNEYKGDEMKAVYEADLLDQREQDGFPGNGWFKYQLSQNNQLTEIHLMTNGGAEIPKVYVVTALSATQLAYYEKDQKKIKFTFTKVTEKK